MAQEEKDRVVTEIATKDIIATHNAIVTALKSAQIAMTMTTVQALGLLYVSSMQRAGVGASDAAATIAQLWELETKLNAAGVQSGVFKEDAPELVYKCCRVIVQDGAPTTCPEHGGPTVDAKSN